MMPKLGGLRAVTILLVAAATTFTMSTATAGAAYAATASPPSQGAAKADSPSPDGKSQDKHYKPAGCYHLTQAELAAKVPSARCFAMGYTNATGQLVQSADDPPPTALGPADIQDAYNLPDTGDGVTVAVVDAFGYDAAESDLAVFRDHYGLPACTTDNGCFKKVDQRGGTDYPDQDPGWSIETALDLDAVSAACPKCHLLLVQGDTNNLDDLGQGAATAASLGAAAISNSYGVPGDFPDEQDYDGYYDHPGIAVTASTGDAGDVTNWPATGPNVAGIGGTTLDKDGSARGWTESAWADGGSGCSPYEPRPDYQADLSTNCPDNKAIADISADADPATGLGIYNTLGESGWAQYGGTSLSSPLVAAMYALAGPAVPDTYPVSYPYAAAASGLNDVTAGTNGSCGNVLCEAGPGWDGPTGLGTPNGVAALSQGPHGTISGTVTDASAGGPLSGATVTATDAAGNSYDATTDDQGNYHLVAPTGTYDVTATKFGYADKSVSGVAVGDGQTVDEDFALAPVPSHTVSGTVTDGSGHGWPMYAKITIDGYPNGAVFTNPYTGRYSVDLPSGHTYSLHVSAARMPGYLDKDVSVQVGDADVHADAALKVDQTTCTAPGYGYTYAGTSTDFEGWTDKTPQDGWTITDAAGTGSTWEFDDPGNRGNLTSGSGNFAIVDSDHAGTGTTQDTSLVSPVEDLTNEDSPEVGFDTDYKPFLDTSVADVDVSVDGGSSWTNVWEQTGTAATGHVDVPLPDAAGKSAVQVRFHYTGDFAYWWELDNVFLGQRTCTPTHGGLVAGIVRDGNTHAPINGAKVASDVNPDEFGVTAATPDDANLPDGFYWLFSSHTGTTAFTASDGKYTAAHGNANVPVDFVVQRNWTLTAGHLTVSSRSLSVTERLGATGSKTVTFGNDGTKPVHVQLSEQDGGFTPMAGDHQSSTPGAPITRIKAPVSDKALVAAKAGPVAGADPQKAGQPSATREATPAAAPWTDIANHPTPVMDNVVAYNDGKVYSVSGIDGTSILTSTTVYDPSTQSWTKLADVPEGHENPVGAFVGGKLYVTGGWDAAGDTDSSTYAYDPSANSWSQVADLPAGVTAAGAASMGGQLWIVGGCGGNCDPASEVTYSYDPGSNSWSQHAGFPVDAAFPACAGLGGELVCAGGTDPASSASLDGTYSYDPGSDSWTQRADMPSTVWAAAYAGSGGKLQVAGGVVDDLISNQAFEYDPAADSWSTLPNANNALYRGGGACGFYKIGGATGNFDATPFSEVLPGYDDCVGAADVPWLSESQTDFTLAPGDSVTVRVTMDSSVVPQPGDYMAKLAIGTDAPYSEQPIDVTMHVTPPASWGKIAGTVRDDAGAPLAGATVQVCTMYDTRTGTCGPVSYTLKTDSDGKYQYWLNKGFNPLQLIAAKQGYQPQSKVAKLFAGETTTVDFALKKG